MVRLHSAGLQRLLQALLPRLEADLVSEDSRPEAAPALGGDSPPAHLTVLHLGLREGEAGWGGVVTPLDASHVTPRLQLEDGQVSQVGGGGGVVLRVDDHVLYL